MSKTKISLYDADPGNNTDIDGINLAEGMAPGLVNNAIRELMAQLKDFQVGSAGDPLTVGGNLAVTGTSSFTGATTFTNAITMSGRLVDALPTGTKMLFQQTAAPVGWTKDTANDNKALRVVSGTAGTGGSIAFTTAFGSQNVGDTTLTTAQIPVHSHTFSGSGNTGDAGTHTHTINDPGHVHGRGRVPLASADGGNPNLGAVDGNTLTAFTGISINAVGNHAHSFSVSGSTGNAGSGNAHTHSLNLAVQYVDVIVATKD
jgi:microcystin-dependent protein